MIKNISLLVLVLSAFVSCKSTQSTSSSNTESSSTITTKEKAPTENPAPIQGVKQRVNKIQVQKAVK